MKEKHTINILGTEFNLVSEENDEYLDSLAAEIEDRIKELSIKSQHINKMEAALFCALDYLDLKIKSEQREELAKSQIDAAQRTIGQLQKENAELKSMLEK